MKTVKHLFVIVVALIGMCGCEENEPNVPLASTLRIVNGIQDIGTIDLRGFEGNISFFGANTIGYGDHFRFTIPANATTDLQIAPAADTLNIILSETITPERNGGIYSFFLLGDSTQVESFLVEESFTNYEDSIFGARFINLSGDSQPLAVRAIAIDTAGINDTTIVATDLSYRSMTGFGQFEGKGFIGQYIFQYLDADGEVLISETVLPADDNVVFKNITLPLIGKFDDGQGGNTLSFAKRIDHF